MKRDDVEIPLTNGGFAIVSKADAQMVEAAGRWFAVRKGEIFYAARNQYLGSENGKQRTRRVYMHSLIMPGGQIDHINGNGLDNRRDNIRIATSSENVRNRGMQPNNKSGFRGVRWCKQKQKWMAAIRHNKRNIHLGFFTCPAEAGSAYLKKAEEIWSPADLARYRAMLSASPYAPQEQTHESD